MAEIKSPVKELLVWLSISAVILIGCFVIFVGVALYQVNETFNVNLAKDAKTEEYLGEIVAERKDAKTGKAVSYQIRRSDGRMIERGSESVRVFKP